MKRTPLRRTGVLRRSSGALRRSGALKRSPPRKQPSRSSNGRRPALGICRACRKRPAVHPHHVVYKQHVPDGCDKDDPRNVLPVCFQCHWDHHYHPDPRRRISLSVLSGETLDLAFHWLGGGCYYYLNRYRGWPDRRVEERLRPNLKGLQ